MREIKFRGKRLDGKGWVYGNLLVNKKHSFIAYYDNEEQYNPHKERIHPETVGQFTGHKDKNGKEIFEGDVVQKEGHVATVIFEDGAFWVGGTILHHANAPHNVEVIGSIYEHPRLLKEATL